MQIDVVSSWLRSFISNVRLSINLCPIFSHKQINFCGGWKTRQWQWRKILELLTQQIREMIYCNKVSGSQSLLVWASNIFIHTPTLQPLLFRWFRKNVYIFFLIVQNAGEDLGVLEGAKPSKDRGGIQQEETILPGQDPFRVEPVLLNGLPGSCRRAALYCLLFVAWTLIQFYKSTCVFRSYLIYPVCQCWSK